MALNINGTTGISGIDGSASAPALQGSDSNTGINFGSDAVNMNTGGTARLQLTNSGLPSNVNTTINNVTGGNGFTVNLADATTDGVLINGGSSQTRTIFRMKAGNATSGSATSIRLTNSSDTDIGQLTFDNDASNVKLMNNVQGSNIQFWTSSSQNSSGSLQRVNISDRGSVQGSGDGESRPAFSFTNDTDTGMYIRASNNIGFATAGAGKYYMGNSSMSPTNDNGRDLGTSSNRWNQVRAGVSNIVTSDRNEKNTITATDLGLDFVNKLTPVSYKLNDGKSGRTHYGLISQDVETLLKSIGKTGNDFAGFCYDKPLEDEIGTKFENPREYYSLRYDEFLAPMIKAIQELSLEVNTLKTKVAALEAG